MTGNSRDNMLGESIHVSSGHMLNAFQLIMYVDSRNYKSILILNDPCCNKQFFSKALIV